MEQPTNSSKESLKTEEATYEIDKDLKVKVLWFYQHKKREGDISPIEEEENPNEEEIVDILFSTEHKGKLVLHWGCYKAQYQSGWNHPPKEV